MLRKITWSIVLIIVVIGGYFAYSQYAAGLYYLAGQYDRMMNPYGVDPEAPEPTSEDRDFHQSLFIADLHIDTLKWERDLLERSSFGHADVPRLAEGNVGLQVFTIVTKSPLRMPALWRTCVSNGMPDTNTPLAFLQGRPVFGLRDRAMHQIERFHHAVARSKHHPGPELRLIENADDLARLVADRQEGEEVIGGVLGIEGGHWVGRRGIDTVRADMRELHEAGIRLFAPTHRFDNRLSGANEGCRKHGLSELGRAALQEAENLGMAVDLAHISSAGLFDAVNLLEKPFMVSHTGIRAECEEPCQVDRNISDEDIALIAANGGLIGVGFWPQAIGPSVWRIADVMEHIMAIARDPGADNPSHHVALGSDYDGSVTPLIELGHLDVLTTIMRQRPDPFGPAEIRNIMGGNACRLFATVLPGGSAETAARHCPGSDQMSE